MIILQTRNLIFFVAILFSFCVSANDYSGLYQGLKCKSKFKCSIGTNTFDNKVINFTIKHNLNNTRISIYFHEMDKEFLNMKLINKNFNGKINFNSINGEFNINDESVSINYYNSLGDQRFYIKGSKDKNTTNAINKESSNTKDKNNYTLQINNLERDIRNLTLQIEKLTLQFEDVLFLIDDLYKEIEVVRSTKTIDNDLKLLLLELETRLILLEND